MQHAVASQALPSADSWETIVSNYVIERPVTQVIFSQSLWLSLRPPHASLHEVLRLGGPLVGRHVERKSPVPGKLSASLKPLGIGGPLLCVRNGCRNADGSGNDQTDLHSQPSWSPAVLCRLVRGTITKSGKRFEPPGSCSALLASADVRAGGFTLAGILMDRPTAPAATVSSIAVSFGSMRKKPPLISTRRRLLRAGWHWTLYFAGFLSPSIPF